MSTIGTVRVIDQSDLDACARGNNMVAMSVTELRELDAHMAGNPDFAAKVTIIAARQMLRVKLRNGAQS